MDAILSTDQRHQPGITADEGGIVYIAIAIALVVLSIVFHELGHALAMRSRGVEIEAMGFGFGPFGLKIASRPFKCSFGSKTIFTLGILPIGAYVLPSKTGTEKLESLSYSDKAQIMGAGILANFAFAFLLFMLCGSIRHQLFSNPFGIKVMLISGAGTILLWFGRKYVMPLAGLVLFGYTIFTVATFGPSEAVVGPVGIGKFVAQHASGLPTAIFIAALLSLAIGIMNMMPFLPFDGGQTIRALIVKVAPRLRPAYERLSIILMFVLLSCVIYSDVFRR